jgi:hypothetical protein
MGWISIDNKTIKIDQGKYSTINPLHIGDRVRLSSGEIGGIQRISVCNSLPRFLIQTESRIRWVGKTKIKAVYRDIEQM